MLSLLLLLSLIFRTLYFCWNSSLTNSRILGVCARLDHHVIRDGTASSSYGAERLSDEHLAISKEHRDDILSEFHLFSLSPLGGASADILQTCLAVVNEVYLNLQCTPLKRAIGLVEITMNVSHIATGYGPQLRPSCCIIIEATVGLARTNSFHSVLHHVVAIVIVGLAALEDTTGLRRRGTRGVFFRDILFRGVSGSIVSTSRSLLGNLPRLGPWSDLLGRLFTIDRLLALGRPRR
mmetsp:Transcript_3658/g.10416  ORF Transcript_3658/g.10416 Transcript_3658/m.10416 type:complete len:237 (-) Transcript_3658:626-1336(-)